MTTAEVLGRLFFDGSSRACGSSVRSRAGGSSVRSGASRATNPGCRPGILGDKYYFKPGHIERGKYCPLKRDPENVRGMVKCLNAIGLLKVLQPAIKNFDSLHTEYLLQTISDRLYNHRLYDHAMPQYLQAQRISSQGSLTGISTHLHSTLRKKNTSSKILHAIDPVPSVIQKTIKKHFLDKPKIFPVLETLAPF